MIETTNGYVELEGGTLYYETIGTGTPVILSHAAFLDSRMFDAQWELLEEHFQVIRYDMRGFGKSSAAQGPLCRRADLRHLLDHLEIQQAHLVGCSNGGEIMLDLVLEQPDFALSLTLIGSTPSGFEMQGEMPPHMNEMFEALQTGDVEQANELQIRIWIDGAFREPNAVNAELRDKALMMNRIPVQQQTFLIADMQPVCPLDPPAITRLSEIQCPVLVMAGTLDHPEIVRAAEVMSKGIANARKVLVESAGHVPSFEKADVVNPILLDFLLGQ